MVRTIHQVLTTNHTDSGHTLTGHTLFGVDMYENINMELHQLNWLDMFVCNVSVSWPGWHVDLVTYNLTSLMRRMLISCDSLIVFQDPADSDTDWLVTQCCWDVVVIVDASESESGQVNDLNLGCQTSDSASSSNFHHWPLLALLGALVLH